MTNIIEITNEDGFKERWAIQDDDDIEEAQEIGIYVGVPDLSSIDWEGLHRRIHNALHDHGFFTMKDVNARGAVMNSVIKVELTRQIINLYGV